MLSQFININFLACFQPFRPLQTTLHAGQPSHCVCVCRTCENIANNTVYGHRNRAYKEKKKRQYLFIYSHCVVYSRVRKRCRRVLRFGSVSKASSSWFCNWRNSYLLDGQHFVSSETTQIILLCISIIIIAFKYC